MVIGSYSMKTGVDGSLLLKGCQLATPGL
jgi:hypothetical protein